MSNVNGVVEATSNKFGKFSVNVGGNWYATKEEWAPNPRPSKGDVVEFDDGGGKYLKRCRIVGGGSSAAYVSANGPQRAEPDNRQQSIVRQNALTNAVNVWTEIHTYLDALPEDTEIVSRIIQLARGFEFYTSGELDKREAEKFED